jgi:hypothetical protein
VTLLQGLTSLRAQLPTGFPLKSALAAQLSQIRRRGAVVDSARASNKMKKVPPGEAAHFFSARA